MARLTAEIWGEVRARREAGTSFPELAAEFGVSHQAIQKRAKAEGWGDGADVQEIIRRKTAEKVAGIVATCNQAQKAAAIDAVVSNVVSVVERHRKEWDEHKTLITAAVTAEDMDKAKLAKIIAETLKIRQEGERKAWGLDVPAQAGANSEGNKTIIVLNRESVVKPVSDE